MKNRRVRSLVVAVLCLFAIGAFSLVAAWFSSGVNTVAITNVVPLPTETSITDPTMDLKGVWTHRTEKGGVFEATISDTSIKILMKTSTDTSMVYWNGTFESRQVSGAVVNSAVNDDAFTLSKSKNKDFVVGNDTVTFDYTQAGMTKKVELRRG